MGDFEPAAFMVWTTLSSHDDAVRIARGAVEQGLAACVQIDGPLLSVYRWKGDLCEEQEWRCVIKTSSSRYSALEAWLQEAHPYDEPEIVALPVQRGSAGYLRWLERGGG